MDRRQFMQGAGALAAASAGAVPSGTAAVETAAVETAAVETAALRFPPGFLWGTASAAYQVEGRADRAADCIWDTFCKQPHKIRDGSNGDIADDDYHRFPETIALVSGAGLKAYRFSVAWARVQPTGSGQTDAKGFDYYSRVVDALLKAGVEPWLCLYHWDLPQALQDKGGWTGRDVTDRYADYAGLVARKLGDRVKTWLTLNEPSVHGIIGHGLGLHAPGLYGQGPTLAALHHLNLAHGKGVAALRAIGGSRFRIGSAQSIQPARPSDNAPANVPAAKIWDAIWNRSILDAPLLGRYPALLTNYMAPLVKPGDLAQIRQKVDFIGINYYGPSYLKADPNGLLGANWGAVPDNVQRTKLTWPIDPAGLVEVLTDLRDHYGNPPVYITENGACYADTAGPGGKFDDAQRVAFLREHLTAAHTALAQKCNLRGYFAWTIADNFEWAEGYTAPFGLVHIDRTTLARTPKASYDWYSRVAHTNAV